MAQSEPKLSDLVQVDETPRPSAYQVGKFWVNFLIEPRMWPEALRHIWLPRVRILPADISLIKERFTSLVDPGPGEVICLCEHTRGCDYKTDDQLINPSCPRNVSGICVDATRQSNSEPILLDNLGLLFDVSKQRIDQIYDDAIASLIREIYEDPVLRQYCRNKGLKLIKRVDERI